MASQMKPKERRAQILTEAVRQAALVGYQNIERQKIADALGVSPALISARVGTMPELKELVLKTVAARVAALKKTTTLGHILVPCPLDMAIVAQGILAKERRVMRLPEQMRAMALSMQHS